jgi:hypothetical protein
MVAVLLYDNRYCGNLNREIEPRRLARLFGLWVVCNQHLMRWFVLRLFAEAQIRFENNDRVLRHPRALRSPAAIEDAAADYCRARAFDWDLIRGGHG